MKVILLSNGESTLVSDEDWLWLCPYNWYSRSGYATASISGKHMDMHLMIAERMNLDCSNDIDHEDRDRLNNQRLNLRPATRSQNQGNTDLRSSNTSGHKGVTYDKKRQKWVAQITINGKNKGLGHHVTAELAAQAYNNAAKLYFGEFANVVEPLPTRRI